MLSDHLAHDLAWRKKELSDLRYLFDSSFTSNTRKHVLSRSGVTILYAHWEGYVKKAGQNYLKFVTMQKLSKAELADNFLAILLQNKFAHLGSSNKSSAFHCITSYLIDDINSRASIPYKTAINTESNLSSKVFKEIVWCLGLDYAPYESKEKLIDSKLLNKRNYIAHGEDLPIDFDEYVELHEEIINIMNIFKNQLENMAITQGYKKNLI